MVELQPGAKGPGMQMVFMVVEPTVARDSQIEIAIPVVGWFGTRFCTQQVEWGGAVEGIHSQTVTYRLDAHLPVARVGTRVIVAITDQSLDRQIQRLTRAYKPVLDIGGIGALLHPHALFEQSVSAGKGPYRSCTLEAKALDVPIALRVDCPARPAVCSQ